jgi:hypothetical protein
MITQPALILADLYDMQRARMDVRLGHAMEEGKVWHEHACRLAVQMAEKENQHGVQRLRVRCPLSSCVTQ